MHFLNPALRSLLPGPLDDLETRVCMDKIRAAFHNGTSSFLHEEWRARYGPNYCIPFTITPGFDKPSYHVYLAVISEPDDAARVLRTNVRKSPMQKFSFLRDGIVSTTDNVAWKAQRDAINPAFLPNQILAESVFPITLRRALSSAADLVPNQPFNAHAHFMWEALTQLQLGLFGETPEQSNATTQMLLDAFKDAIYVGPNMHKTRLASAHKIWAWAADFEARAPQGPAAQCLLANSPQDPRARLDTIASIGFAGHDTTANTVSVSQESFNADAPADLGAL